MALPPVPARADGGFPSTMGAGKPADEDMTRRGGPGVAPAPPPGRV